MDQGDEHAAAPAPLPKAANPPDDLGLEEVAPSRQASDPEHHRLRSLVEQRLFSRKPAAATIGRYTLLRPIGRGGMGIVYEAYDPELDRKVAIKLVHAAGEEKDGHSRLQREAQAMARLTHQNVVQVFDVGTHRDQVYVVMELVDGLTLRRWIDLRRREPLEIVERFLDAGRGLAAAHGNGVVHRDFKPDNVFIGKDGRVLVGDFGLAGEPRGLTSSSADDSEESEPSPTLTRAGTILGTPAYMSPEQQMGKTVDPRSDQFSYCVALYEALHGRRPFKDKGRSRLTQIESGALKSSAAAPAIPPSVSRAISKGLNFDPADRFADMDGLLEALGPKKRRNRSGVVVAVSAVAITVALATWGLASKPDPCAEVGEEISSVWNEDVRARLEAGFAGVDRPYAAEVAGAVVQRLEGLEAEWVRTRRDACEATQTRHEQSEHLLDLRVACLDDRALEMSAVLELFVNADEDVVNNAHAALDDLPAIAACSDSRALLEGTPPPSPQQRERVETLQVRLRRARALSSAGKYPAALEAVGELTPEVVRLDYRPLQAELFLLEGELQRSGERIPESVAAYRRAAQAAAAAGDRRLEFDAWRGLGLATGEEPAHARAATEHFDQARAVLEAIGVDADREARLTLNRASVKIANGEFEQASELCELALETAGDADNPSLSMAIRNMRAIAAMNLGDFEHGLADLQKVLARAEFRGEGTHPSTANMHLNIANAYYFLGRYQPAIEHLERALAIYVANMGESHANVALVNNNLGNVYAAMGEGERAVRHLERALAIYGQVVGEDHQQFARSLSSLGAVLAEQRRFPESLELHERALAIRERKLGDDHPDVAIDLTGIGRAKLAAGEPTRAREVLERALAIYDRKPGEPGDQAATEFTLAQALRDERASGPRSITLARAAKSRYLELGSRGQEEVERIEAWLASPAPAPEGSMVEP